MAVFKSVCGRGEYVCVCEVMHFENDYKFNHVVNAQCLMIFNKKKQLLCKKSNLLCLCLFVRFNVHSVEFSFH